MALGIGNKSLGAVEGSQASCTFSHNHNGTYLVVGIGLTACNTDVASLSVTYDGVAMTQIGTAANGVRTHVWLFGLATTNTGAHNVIASWTNDAWGMCYGQTITGEVSGVSGFVSASAATIDVTSATGSYVIDVINCYGDSVFTVGADQTQIYQNGYQSDAAPTTGDYTCVGGSYQSGAASVTMDWTSTTGTKVICACSIDYDPDVTVTPTAASCLASSTAPTFKHYFTPTASSAIAKSVSPTFKYTVTPTAASAVASTPTGIFRTPILLHAPYRKFLLTAPERSMTLHAPYRKFSITAPDVT